VAGNPWHDRAGDRIVSDTCTECGSDKDLKRGWTNSWYCSENCELIGVSGVHGSMPGAGGVPSRNWVPHHTGLEISRRWADSS